MRYAVAMEKTTPGIADTATKTRKEMTEFVSYYRRFPNVAGKLSYSNLYTSVNVLAGHYASYGPKFPVPEKRKKRLYQEFNDIEKALKRSVGVALVPEKCITCELMYSLCLSFFITGVGKLEDGGSACLVCGHRQISLLARERNDVSPHQIYFTWTFSLALATMATSLIV
jgi:hypothetical protein